MWHKTVRFCLIAMEIHGTEYPCWLQLHVAVCVRWWPRVVPAQSTFALPSSMDGPMVVLGPADSLKWASVFHTNVCMCKACESNIRCSLKKQRNGESFIFWWVKKCCILFWHEAVDAKTSKHAFTWEGIHGMPFCVQITFLCIFIYQLCVHVTLTPYIKGLPGTLYCIAHLHAGIFECQTINQGKVW